MPALPLTPVLAQPPLPLAAMWAAYGWSSDASPDWRAPAALAFFGLLHDQLAGGPYGLFMSLYLLTFLVGRIATGLMSAPNLLSLWGGFIITGGVVTLVAAVLSRIALGSNTQIWGFAETVAITAIFFPLVRGLYMNPAQGAR
ncbi:MAG: hypothetical protein ABW199_02695 [Caulobacterales bacterium]